MSSFSAAASEIARARRTAPRPAHAEPGLAGSGYIAPEIIGALVRATEIVTLAAAGIAAALLVPGGVSLPSILLAPAAAAVCVVLLDRLGAYTLAGLGPATRATVLPFAVWTLVAALAGASLFAAAPLSAASVAALAAWYATGLGALLVTRALARFALRQLSAQGRLTRRAVIFGADGACADLIAELTSDRDSRIEICGVFDDRSSDRIDPAVARYPLLGKLGDLVAYARSHRVDLVILTLPLAAEGRLVTLMRELEQLPFDVRLAASATSLKLPRSSYDFAGGVAMIALADKPLRGWAPLKKAMFDTVVGTLALIAAAPVMAAIALAIKLDSRGPVFFRQKRHGFNNEVIEVLKFRSLYHDQCDPTARRLVTRDDPRVTRVGRFIRKTSLDELPQLFNVLSGELSLVGPRPHAVDARTLDFGFAEAIDRYFARHKVKPGITGWAQIHGWRGEITSREAIEQRVAHDLHYIESWSLWLDLEILLRTPSALLNTRNAY